MTYTTSANRFRDASPANRFRDVARIMSDASLRDFAKRADYRGQIAREVLTRRGA